LLEAKKPDLFEKILMKLPENLPEPETTRDKVMKAYARMRKKARKQRKMGNKTWEPKMNRKVLVRAQPALDSMVGVTAKHIHPCEGPYIYVLGVVPPSIYEISTTVGRLEESSIKRL
jgi:hypothetical protein